MKQRAPGELYNAQALALGWAGHCDPGLHFDRPEFVELAQLWYDLRGDAALPARDAMTARRLKDLLPSIAFYERFIGPDGHPRHRVRLEGMRFVRIYGSHTGQVVQDYLPPQHASRFALGLEETLAAMAPLRFLARTDSGEANFLSAEFCNLPLADNQGQPAMVLVCAHFSPAPWKDYFDAAMARLKAAQAKSLASAVRASAVKTAI
ncbi:MAG: PAS domain-containing protein [Alphaproteobacteria bacterium]|nr:PAS domain-containing protein [Alphaproteobacteria bacterium]